MNITAILVGYGAGTIARVVMGSVNLITFTFGVDALGTTKSINDVVLNAGETIIGGSDAANPTINYSASVQESPL